MDGQHPSGRPAAIASSPTDPLRAAHVDAHQSRKSDDRLGALKPALDDLRDRLHVSVIDLLAQHRYEIQGMVTRDGDALRSEVVGRFDKADRAQETRLKASEDGLRALTQESAQARQGLSTLRAEMEALKGKLDAAAAEQSRMLYGDAAAGGGQTAGALAQLRRATQQDLAQSEARVAEMVKRIVHDGLSKLADAQTRAVEQLSARLSALESGVDAEFAAQRADAARQTRRGAQDALSVRRWLAGRSDRAALDARKLSDDVARSLRTAETTMAATARQGFAQAQSAVQTQTDALAKLSARIDALATSQKAIAAAQKEDAATSAEAASAAEAERDAARQRDLAPQTARLERIERLLARCLVFGGVGIGAALVLASATFFGTMTM